MSAETLKYQRELLRGAKRILRYIQVDEPMRATDFTNLILAISKLEDVRDIAATMDEGEKTKIMNKWL